MTSSPRVVIRPVRLDDLGAITAIYNEAILTTTSTFDTKPKTILEQKTWLESHGPRLPVLVAETNGEIVGWTALSAWSDRCAYKDTAEISTYISEKSRGQGVGSKLINDVLAKARTAGVHTVIARIAEGNEDSIRVHESFGFFSVGIMKEVGRKFGRLLDVHIMQKIFP